MNTTKNNNLPSTIQMKMREINQRKKYFKSLQHYEIEQHNKTVERAMLQCNYSELYNAIISNNVQSMYDLDRINANSRGLILSATADKGTFDKLVSKCWAVHPQVKNCHPITRLQHITTNLSQVFQ